MPELVGKSIGHYQILSKVDEGGMATIFKAFDTHLERHVAIKIIRKESFSPDMLALVLKRFEREAKSLAQLSHPNIVKVIDFGEYEGSPYLVLEFLSGGTLKQRLQGKITTQDGLKWLIPISHALAYAHHRGVIHRDVKPSNILFTETNEPMLSDFGIAKILEADSKDALTGSGVGIGTPEYMAPEQGLGQAVDARTDIYSMGIVLYEILTGRRPFQADTPMSIVLKHVSEPLPSPRKFDPTIPELAEQILEKALAKSPDDRYPDMATFSTALTQLSAQYFIAPGSRMPVVATEVVAPIANLPLQVQAAGAQPAAEEDTGKLIIRISRLEKVVEESLAAEDFLDAENLITTIDGLGEHGRQAASRLRASLDQTRTKARQRDADISSIRIAFPQALEAEDLPKAEALLSQLQGLGPKGMALAKQFQVAIETAKQQIAVRQAEINRLKNLTEENIAEENFSQAEALIMSLSVIGKQAKPQAAALQEALDKARKQAGQRKGEIYRLNGLAEKQIAEKEWEAARKTLSQLSQLGAEGKAASESLGERLKKAESEVAVKETAPASQPVEQLKTSTSVPAPARPAPVPEKRKIPTLVWIAVGAVILILGMVVGGGVAMRIIGNLTSTREVSQGSQPTQVIEPTPAPTTTAGAVFDPTAPPTMTAATPIPQSTATAYLFPTATSEPSRTSTPTAPPRYEVTVDTDNANIRTGPGTVYNIIGSKPRGTVLEATGRNEAGDWLVIQLDKGQIGWISMKVIQLSFDPNLLPVIQAPPTPLAPTKRPTEGKSGEPSGPSNPPTWTPPPP